MTGYCECFEQAVTAAISGATVLTSNTRSARAIRSAAEERLRLSSAAWLTPAVMPFGAFIERLYSDAIVAGVLRLHPLQREQELQLWRQLIERSSSGRELLLPDSAAALASESFRTAAEYQIALNSAQMNVSSDTRAFSGWAAEFTRQLAAHGWTCPALYMRELTPYLSSLKHSECIHIYVAELTPAQRTFLDGLAAAEVNVSIVPDVDEAPTTNLSRHEFDGVANELRAAAAWARQELETSPDSRIGIILFDLGRKLNQVEHTFRSVLHPEHLLGQNSPSVFEIAAPIPLAEYPVVHCALQLLAIFAAPIDFHVFCEIFRSPYIDADSEAAAKFIARVRKQARRQVSIENLASWLRESSEFAHFSAALELLPQQATLANEHPAPYWADVSRKILEAFGWPGQVTLNSEEFQCTESWRDLLVAVSSLEVLDWRTDFSGFLQRLTSAAANKSFKPESHNAPIQIMDVAESEGSVFDALWIGSGSDDLWPDSPRHSPLIPIALLREAGVPLVGSEATESRTRRITSRLLQSAPVVRLSMARRTDDEREQRWSPLFATCPEAPEDLAQPPLLAERFPSANLEALQDASAPPLHADEAAHGGTSLLQEQSLCPFQAFAKRRLLAKEAEGPSEAVAPTERGKVVELALQLIWEELKDSTGLQRPDLAAVVESSVDRAMVKVLPSTGDAWTIRFRRLERQRTIEVIAEWLSVEASRPPFEVLGHQLDVEIKLGGLAIKGRLDRLDRIADSHVVLDYKTGAAIGVSAWQVPRPRMPQMPFYAVAMRQQSMNLAGISFAVVRKGECGFKGYLQDAKLLPCTDPSKRTFEGSAFDEYTLLWTEELERLAAAFVQGAAAVDPKVPPSKNGSSCEYCHLTALCRVGDIAIDDGDGDAGEENNE